MNSKFSAVVLGVVGLLVIAFGAYQWGAATQSAKFGTATISYYSALGNAALRNALDSIYTDLLSTRAPLAGTISYSSSTFTLPTPQGGVNGGGIATTTISSSTGGASALASVAQGDFVIVSITSSSIVGKGMVVKGEAPAAGTVLLTFLGSASSTMPTGLVGLDLRILPKATFAAPAATTTAQVSTSSSQ